MKLLKPIAGVLAGVVLLTGVGTALAHDPDAYEEAADYAAYPHRVDYFERVELPERVVCATARHGVAGQAGGFLNDDVFIGPLRSLDREVELCVRSGAWIEVSGFVEFNVTGP